MKIDKKWTAMLLLSSLAGLLIAWNDSRPGWDDTGITTGLIVLCSALFGFLLPTRPWIWALTVGIWIPLYSIVASGDFKMFLVMLFSLAGSYLGAAVKNNKPVESEK